MKKTLVALALGLAVLLPISAKAAFFQANESGVENIGKDRTVRNAYIAGSTVNVEGDVQKDLFAAASTINLNGKVEDDLTAVGENINVKAAVGGSARMAGSIINIDNRIGEDLLAAVNEMVLTNNSQIIGDLVLASSKTELKGEVDGDVKFIGNQIIISGVIKGNVLAKNVNKLTVTRDARIEGKLTYNSPNEATIEGGSTILGGVDYTKVKGKGNNEWNNWHSYTKKASTGLLIYQLIGTIFLLLLFIYLFPRIAKKYIENSFTLTFKNFWIGLVALIVTPIIAILLLAISIKLTFIALLVYILFLTLASSFAALLIGSWILKAIRKSQEHAIDWQSVVLGTILAVAIAYIPIAGAIFLFLLLLISFGSLLTMSYDSLTAK